KKELFYVHSQRVDVVSCFLCRLSRHALGRQPFPGVGHLLELSHGGANGGLRTPSYFQIFRISLLNNPSGLVCLAIIPDRLLQIPAG
ncbi:MAG TPA: hypothetical protein PLS32_08945, partial [Bacillota bacterium]|nr:hypothetical protein [Bacillota bacterium]